MRTGMVLAAALVLGLVAGCSGKEEDEDSGGRDAGSRDAGTTDAGSDDAGFPGGSATLSGKVTYDFVPATYSPATLSGTLAFHQATVRPVRNAVVRVLHGSTILASTTTDEQGNYRVTYTAPAGPGLSVVALAKTTTPAIQIEDNTDGDATWAIGAGISATDTVRDLRATHGWTGTAYDTARRTAAPFAILDSMYTAARAFMAVRPVEFPELRVNWSPDNVPEIGDTRVGQIGTSLFNPRENEIYILGKAGVDTDEFDNHVIVHEWGHFFEYSLSRSDSPGGPHSPGELLDPRLAFSEGYGNAVSGMLLSSSIYVDTSWVVSWLPPVAFGFDLESASFPNDDPSPGAFSETSVMRLLHDLFDSGTNEEGYDQVSIGLGTFYDVLVGPQRTTPALTTVGSFIAGLKAQPGVNASEVNTLLAHYGIGPVTSPWGDGDAALRSIYTQVPAYPYSTTVTLEGGEDYNKREQNRYYVFNGTGRSMTFSATSSDDVGIAAYHQGRLAGWADADYSGTETFNFTTEADAVYVLVVTGFKETRGAYSASLSITSE
jgi:hypothetical protein